jgi:Flp pilus assembly protein CpaB
MINDAGGLLIHYLRRLPESENAQQLTDGQLLERYLRRRDEWAFVALVRRHAPMVLGVCRRVLRHADDAEDAFQATFLVLVRKAAAIGKRESVGSWLYKVAYRVSFRARQAAYKRRLVERQVALPTAREATADELWWELRTLLDEELARLPEKYRNSLVVCYLEGKTKEEAARQLGCPPGTISSRLARGREILRSRLAQRGVVVSAAGLATAMSSGSASASASLVDSTVQAALAATSGKIAAGGAVSASVTALTEGMVRTMFLAKLKIVMVALLALGVAASGVGWVAMQARAQIAQASQEEKGKTPDAKAQAANRQDKPEKHEPTAEVAVTRFPLNPYSPLTIEAFAVRQIPTSLAEGWLLKRDVEELIRDGKVLKLRIAKDKPLTLDDFYDPAKDFISGKLSLGETAWTIKVTNAPPELAFLQPGFRVDIEARTTESIAGRDTPKTQNILQNIQILAIGNGARDPNRPVDAPDMVTLRLAREQAIVLGSYQQGSATFRLLARQIQDNSVSGEQAKLPPPIDRLQRLPTELLFSKRPDDQVVDAIYLTTLCRLPTETEKKAAMANLANSKDRFETVRRIVAALTNTEEFEKHVDTLHRHDPRIKK